MLFKNIFFLLSCFLLFRTSFIFSASQGSGPNLADIREYRNFLDMSDEKLMPLNIKSFFELALECYSGRKSDLSANFDNYVKHLNWAAVCLQLEPAVFPIAACYFRRYCKLKPLTKVKDFEDTLMTSLLLASKFIDDLSVVVSDFEKGWFSPDKSASEMRESKITIKEIKALEVNFAETLEWKFFVSFDDITGFLQR